jgi:hypothetical protein
MPTPLNVGGVVGIDNISPIYNPDAKWQIWNMSEIYLGHVAENKYVPKIGDLVIEITGVHIAKFIVKDINPSTMVPVFLAEEVNSPNAYFTPDDVLIGVGPGQQSDTYRVYVDQSVSPYRMSVDARLKVAGSMCNYCKIFRGSDVSSDTGNVISRVYDTSGQLVSENIALELAATQLLDNKTIKTVAPAYTTAPLDDGELVTAIFYDAAGFVVSKRQLLVENTAYIRSADADMKYIIGISLRSPFIASTNARLIQYPINVPLNSLNLIGVVTYSNGEVKEYPVDGTKFTLFGLDQYVATVIGQRIKLVLKYSLAPNEYNYSAIAGADTHISAAYEAVTLSADGTYGVKLFPYPVWVDSVSGYRLKWYMYNLSRDIFYDVTTNVVINTAVTPYDPIAYGVLQHLSVSVNLKDVNGIYKSYIHTQTVDVVIARQGTERLTNWLIGFSPDQSPRYGQDTYAAAYFIGSNTYRLNLANKQTNLNDWLNKVYLKTQPLYNPTTETGPLTPTHFVVMVGSVRTEYSIAQWSDNLTISANVANSSTVFVQFIKRTPTQDLQLSIAGMPVYYVDVSGNVIV